MTFKLNRKFRQDYSKIFKRNPEAANLFLLLTELADEKGQVHLWRKSLDSGWIKNPRLWAFWCWCILKATHKEFDAIVGLQLVRLKPGQFIFGRRQASIETGLSERQIRTSPITEKGGGCP